MFINLLWFIATCIVLVKSASTLVGALSKIASYLRITEFVIGFMIMAFATSIPELSIGVSSAMGSTVEEPLTNFALGNVIGANIIDLTLVIGIAAILRRNIKVETKAVRTDTIYMFLIAAVPVILMMDREISRIDGIILLLVFIIYVFRLLTQKNRFREKIKTAVPKKEFHKNLVYFIISIILLFISAHFLIKYAKLMAYDLSISPCIIALFGISLGTTLPELTFETKAVLSEHQYMALGDLIGSVIANSTLILGLTAVIFPIHCDDITLYLISAFFMLVVAFLFMTFIEAERHIIWQEGMALIFLYILFMIVMLSIGSIDTLQVVD
jgi:cation:H+ antiporter